MVAPLRRVLVRRPPRDVSGWRDLGWHGEPDAARLAAEHEAFCRILEDAGAEVVVGEPACMHLLSLLSALDDDLVVAYPPLMPVRLVQLLGERGIEIVEVPDDEFDSMGPNVLALAPRVALALAGNEETRRRLERAGVEVAVYEGDELSRKGDGGPTCLTRPLLRDAR